MNSIIESVLTAHGIAIPEKPIIQRNQNQSAVGGSDLTNPRAFNLCIEVKRHETPDVNAFWRQVTAASLAFGGIPVVIYRQNGKRNWNVVLEVDVPFHDGAHMGKVRATIDWNSFLQWFYNYVDRLIKKGEWYPDGK